MTSSSSSTDDFLVVERRERHRRPTDGTFASRSCPQIMFHEACEVLMGNFGTTLVTGAQMNSIDMYAEVYLRRQMAGGQAKAEEVPFAPTTPVLPAVVHEKMRIAKACCYKGSVMASLTPMPPGQYGVRVVRGPSFCESRCGDRYSGQDVLGMGTTVVPSNRDLSAWAANLLMSCETEMCAATFRTFTPWRSCRVLWDETYTGDLVSNRANDDVGGFYYKAGDECMWDIATDRSWKIQPPHVVCLDTPSGSSDDNSFLPREFDDRTQKQIFQRVCDKFVTYMHAINEEEYSSSHDVQRMITEEIEMMNNNWVFLQSNPPKPRVVWDYVSDVPPWRQVI